MALALTVGWKGILLRTWRDARQDDIVGLAAELAYYFFLALFPGMLFLLAVASFFPLHNLTDDLARSLGPFVSPEIVTLLQEQMQRIANDDSAGLLTFGVAGALWSSSAAIVSIVNTLNRAYDIEETRPWWKVRLIAIALTIALALGVLVALSIVLANPQLPILDAGSVWNARLAWAWSYLQWPLAVGLVSTSIGLLYYFAPDADQDWVWITPGAAVATVLWLVASLLFRFYTEHFGKYDAYGAVGGVMVALLWFYVSGLALLVGAELNAEIERAYPHSQGAKQVNSEGKRMLGARAERAYCQAEARPSKN